VKLTFDNKLNIYKDICSLFLTKEPAEELANYLTDSDNEDYYTIWKEYIINHLKKEIAWSTGIGLLEAIDHIYLEAESNDNFRHFERISNEKP